MKLKRLLLQGYKTFASKTNFEFDEGITAVVGPNGSGKSNIADAIRWVLGEQSYSTLRGKRTTDMIFAGSQQRARAGMAQAILTLDNSEGWLPIDFSEIEIGRRAYRSGDNEYLLNGQKVRLRDITELLARSGLAQRTYTIIGQGLIDQALSLRAEERRMLFEEAAGVSHYKQRRAETLRRLDETTHNLERVQDIIAEIRPRMSALRRQANRARNYEQLAADLRHTLQIWYGYKWEQTRKNLRSARRESEEARKLWMEARATQLNLQEQLEASRKTLNSLQERQRVLELERDDLRGRLEGVRREVAVLSERKSLLKRQLDEHADELPALKSQQQLASEQLEQAVADLKPAQSEADRQSEHLQSFEASFLSQQNEIDRWQQDVANLESERRQAADALSQAKGRVAQLASQLRERLTDSGDGFDPSAEEEEVKRCVDALNAARLKHSEAQRQMASKHEQRRAIGASLDATRLARDKLSSELSMIERKIAANESRLEILGKPGAAEGQIPADLPVLGQLASALEVPERYQMAVRSALADRYLTWLLADETAIWQLREERGQGRILAIEAHAATGDAEEEMDNKPVLPNESSIIGWADDLIKTQKPFDRLASRLLGRVLIVASARAAYQAAGWLPDGFLAVSTDGFVAHSDGVVELGAESVGAARSARIEQAKQVTELLQSFMAERIALTEELAESDDRLAQLQSSLSEVAAEYEALAEEERKLGAAESQAHSAHRLAEQRLGFQASNATRARRSIARLEERVAEGESTVVHYEGALAKISSSLKEAQTRLANLPVAESAEARKQLQQNLQSAQTILAGRQAVVDSRQTTLDQVTDQLRRRQARFDELQRRWQASELESKQKALLALQEEMKKHRQRLDPLRKKITEGQREVAMLDDRLSKIQRSGHESETRYTQARIDLTQQESLMDSLKERIHADLGLVALTYDDDQPTQSPLPIAEVVEQLPVVDSLPEDIEESIQHYRGQLNRIGAINPEAPAEYQETVDRYEFLTQQTEDLLATRERLREVIEDLDDLTSKAFAQTVDKVDGVFGEVFERLFGGGSAQLALTDPDDLTITGVDIVARLPRRREQGLALLSGGERSLTAAALIFALLKVSPTPFCVLDEVDAMLDEANVNRFRELLTELSERTQFIVITHNRGTVQVAESVYGVSMGADSASQVISIKPEDYVRQPI